MNSIAVIMQNIINNIVWPIFAGAVVIMFLYAGFLFLSATGKPEKLTKAKVALLYAMIGVVVGILAFSAQNIIKGVLGV